MATVSSRIPAASPAAASGGGTEQTPRQPGDVGAPPRGHTRARVTPTDGDSKGSRLPPVWRDLTGSGLFDMAPPSMRELRTGRVLSADQVPDGSEVLRQGGTWWSTLVGIPASIIFYSLAWAFQHFVRFLLALAVVGALVTIWSIAISGR